MFILVINAGSSSLKYELFRTQSKASKNGTTMKSLCEGIIDRIGQPSKSGRVKNHADALQKALAEIQEKKLLKNLSDIQAVGHRVVHGGEKYTQPTLVNTAVLKELKKLSALAPLHNPPNIAGILACQKLLPKAKNVAVFDTAFHQTMPPKAYRYALPEALYKKDGIRRYGFHGCSHAYVSRKAAQLLKRAGKTKIITCHMGNGASIAAVLGGKSIDTSMGYTPLEGIPMGTRSGDIDPAIVLELIKKKGNSSNTLSAIDNLLNKQSGLLAVSGISSDMRDIWAAAQKARGTRGGNSPAPSSPQAARALLAISLLAYRTAKYIGSYAAALRGLDAIVFTAGLGEKAWYLREEIASYLQHLGVTLNKSANKKNALIISAPKSRVKVYVIPTDEEHEIATQTAATLGKKTAGVLR